MRLHCLCSRWLRDGAKGALGFWARGTFPPLRSDAKANRLDASSFTLGPVRLEGGLWYDELIAPNTAGLSFGWGAQVNRLTGGRDDDTFVGGVGRDMIVEHSVAEEALALLQHSCRRLRAPRPQRERGDRPIGRSRVARHAR